ncbi:MAG: magnesium chelatase, partial [Acidimicrobiales bacterium]
MTDSIDTDPPASATIGELRASGWISLPVKSEVRKNLLKRISAGEPAVDGVLGYGDTVLPAIEEAVIAGHDIILLGERGQAKSRIIRSLVSLLDEWSPTVLGSEIND